MKRRKFIQQSGTALLLTPYLGGWVRGNEPAESVTVLMNEMVRENDRILNGLFEQQIERPGHRFDGGISDAYGIASEGSTAIFLQRMASAYIAPGSDWFRSADLLPPMKKAVAYLLQVQHEDGTIDLLSTNFHSPPDTAFRVEPLCLTYTLLQNEKDPVLQSVLVQLKTFLLKAGKALTVGGIHTPNHRWVVSMALARLHTLFPNQAYLDRINAWLAEHIDIDPDGQYNEKSSLVYTPLTNRCLLTIARLADHPELFDPVRQNLEMTLYYLHPNGEVVTEASRRQDQYQVGSMAGYYYAYRYLALKDNNERFQEITHQITQQIGGAGLSQWLAYFQEDPFLQTTLSREPKGTLPTNYAKAFPASNLVRIRRDHYDATILGGGMLFFAMQNGNAVLQGIRCHAAFFGQRGNFVPADIQREGKAFVLRSESVGPYYQPFSEDEIAEDGDWDKMPRQNRQQSEVQKLVSVVRIEESKNGFLLDFSLTGTDHVPVAIELGFRPGGTLSGVRTVADIDDAYLLEGPAGVYQYGQDRISFRPGQMDHTWTQVRGAPPKMKAMSVYLTGFTPFRYQLALTAE